MAITLGGAGGGSEINDNKVINSTADSITTESGEVWLKSGVISGAVSTYPDATGVITGINIILWAYIRILVL